jgi:integrase
VRDLIDDFEREHLRALASGAERYRTLNGDITTWEDRAASSITRGEVQLLIDKVKDRAPRLAVMVLTDLRLAYEHAIARDRVSVNPTAGVKHKVSAVRRDRVLDDPELRRLFKLLGDETKLLGLSATMRDALRLELLTGARQGEVFGLTYAELHGEEWHLPAARVKNATAHVVFLNAPALMIIKRRKAAQHAAGVDTPWLFPTPADPQRAVGPHAIVWSLCQVRDELTMHKIAPFTAHDCRRTAVTLIARLGFGAEVQDRVANHVRGGVRGTYNRHNYDAEARRAWAALGKHLVKLGVL